MAHRCVGAITPNLTSVAKAFHSGRSVVVKRTRRPD
jgi:hypothetical protein